MRIIAEALPPGMLNKAKNFSDLRERCKRYLQKYGMSYDKFTVTENDSFIGYISEALVAAYIKRRYSSRGVQVSTWASRFDFSKIENILKVDSKDECDKLYIRNYFYDKYDLRVSCGDKVIFLDVKSAQTQKTPKAHWKFLYPVIQKQKCGKDYVVLGYYITKSKNITDFKQFVLCGFMPETKIEHYPVKKAGSRTVHGTLSQIDNYETVVKHYKDLDLLFHNLLKKEE